jgi:hypothetical protein
LRADGEVDEITWKALGKNWGSFEIGKIAAANKQKQCYFQKKIYLRQASNPYVICCLKSNIKNLQSNKVLTRFQKIAGFPNVERSVLYVLS